MKNLFTTLTQKLTQANFLSLATNAAIKEVARTDINLPEFIAQILGQYYGLVIEVPHYLSEMALIAKARGWKNIEHEVVRNRAEEYGSRTDGIPHRSLFSRGLRQEMHLDIESFRRDAVTHNFLSALNYSLIDKSPEYALGVIYALEDTATPELLVVGKLISLVYKGVIVENLNNNNLAAKDRQTPAVQLSLEAFLRMHVVDFEVGHREGLKTAIRKDLGDTIGQDFRNGYEFVLAEMESWWWNLAATCR